MSIPVGWKFYPRFGNVGDTRYAVDLNESAEQGVGIHVHNVDGTGVPDLQYETANYSTRSGEDLRYQTFGKRIVRTTIDVVGSSKSDLDRRYQNLVRRIGLSSGGLTANFGALVYTRAADSRDDPYNIWFRTTDYSGSLASLPDPLVDVRYSSTNRQVTFKVLKADSRAAQRLVEALFSGLETAQEIGLSVSAATGLSAASWPSFTDGELGGGPILGVSVYRPAAYTSWTATVDVTLAGTGVAANGGYGSDNKVAELRLTDELTLACGAVGGLDIKSSSMLTPFAYRLNVDWLATNPWWYGPPVRLSRTVGDTLGRTPVPVPASFAVGAGKHGLTFGFGYRGTAATWSTVLEVYGAATNPRLHNARTGADLKFQSSVGSASRLVVIMGPRPVSSQTNVRAFLSNSPGPHYATSSGDWMRHLTSGSVPIGLVPEDEIALDSSGEQTFQSQALIYEQDNSGTNRVDMIFYPEFKGA